MTEEQKRSYRQKFGTPYADFYFVFQSRPPRVCPFCQTQTIRILWLGDPDFVIAGEVWGKWYLWCEECLKGIRCPLGSYRVPKGEPYVRWGDEAALKQGLPAGLQLALPEFPPEGDSRRKQLQELFDARLVERKSIHLSDSVSSDLVVAIVTK